MPNPLVLGWYPPLRNPGSDSGRGTFTLSHCHRTRKVPHLKNKVYAGILRAIFIRNPTSLGVPANDLSDINSYTTSIRISCLIE